MTGSSDTFAGIILNSLEAAYECESLEAVNDLYKGIVVELSRMVTLTVRSVVDDSIQRKSEYETMLTTIKDAADDTNLSNEEFRTEVLEILKSFTSYDDE